MKAVVRCRKCLLISADEDPMRPNTASIAEMVSAAVIPCEPRGEPVTRDLRSMQDEHRACAFADDEVALPMAGLAVGFQRSHWDDHGSKLDP